MTPVEASVATIRREARALAATANLLAELQISGSHGLQEYDLEQSIRELREAAADLEYVLRRARETR